MTEAFIISSLCSNSKSLWHWNGRHNLNWPWPNLCYLWQHQEWNSFWLVHCLTCKLEAGILFLCKVRGHCAPSPGPPAVRKLVLWQGPLKRRCWLYTCSPSPWMITNPLSLLPTCLSCVTKQWQTSPGWTTSIREHCYQIEYFKFSQNPRQKLLLPKSKGLCCSLP